tara:strand:+ start:51 stop:584 length:534 start_codon:yes stop_codon:yes gene_type:complete
MEKAELANLMDSIATNRDQLAFSKLFDFLAPKINAFYQQNGLIKDNAEELTQEVMSTIWIKSHQYDVSKSAVSTWVYTIARNKKVDFLRKNSKNNFKEEDIRDILYEENSDGVISKNEISDQLDKLNSELNEDQRKIIKMNFFENKSHKIIAKELEIPLGTVKSRIRNILIKLQNTL